MKKLETYILADSKNKREDKGIEVMARDELGKLNMGAEITETEDDSDEDGEETNKRKKMSSSMERSIDRLLSANTAAQRQKGNQESKEGIFDEDGNVRFDRRKYDLETFKAILSKINGFDYRDLTVT